MLKNLFTFLVCFILLNNSFASPIPPAPNLNVKSYVLMDYDSGMILASNNHDLTLPPASITKIMTAYLAFTEIQAKNVSLDEEVLISKKAWKTGGS